MFVTCIFYTLLCHVNSSLLNKVPQLLKCPKYLSALSARHVPSDCPSVRQVPSESLLKLLKGILD